MLANKICLLYETTWPHTTNIGVLNHRSRFSALVLCADYYYLFTTLKMHTGTKKFSRSEDVNDFFQADIKILICLTDCIDRDGDYVEESPTLIRNVNMYFFKQKLSKLTFSTCVARQLRQEDKGFTFSIQRSMKQTGSQSTIFGSFRIPIINQ